MKDAVTRTWYRVALARTSGEPLLVAAEGEHLGVAIAAAEKYVDGARAIACDTTTGAGIPLGESVGKQHVVELGPAGDHEALRWPAGVLPQIGATDSLAGANRGYITHRDPRLLVIEAQTNHEHLVDLFLGMVERLPTADNLEVRVLDHFEDVGRTDVWLTSRVNAKKIISFLDDFDTELIDNGHVELSIYVRAHKATLRLSEHKTVVWIADDDSLAGDVKRWLGELEVPAADSLVRLSTVPHFHFRAAKSKGRKKLGDELFRQRLRKVDKIGGPAPVTGPREPD